MEVLVSIIVPCYKQAHFLNESLQSVLDQTYPYWECIIVNDGSPDNTESVVSEWKKKDDRFSYLYKPNGGLSSARNAGIAIAKGEFILPLDADDVLHKDYLIKTIPVLIKNSKLGIVSCLTHFFEKSIENKIYQLRPIGTEWKDLLFVNQLVATSLFRKDCWQLVNGYDESFNKGFEDWDFWLSVTKNGYNYEIVNDYLFYYRKSKKSMLQNTVSNHFYEVRKLLMIKHKELYTKRIENLAEVLFFELKQKNSAYQKNKKSIEFLIGKLILKPIRIIQKICKV